MARGRRRRSGSIDLRRAQSRREAQRDEMSRAAQIATRRVVVAAALAVFVVAVTIVATTWANRGGDATPPDIDAPSDTGAAVLIGLTDRSDQLVSIVLIASHPVEPARLVLFPPSLAAVLPGYGERDISDSIVFGGTDLLRLTVANLLGIRIDAVGVGPVQDFVAVLDGPVDVDLNSPLIVADAQGETVVYGQGIAERSTRDLARLLSEQGEGDQLAWLVRQGAVWEAILDRASEDGEVLDGIVEVAGVGTEVAYQALSTAVVADPLRITAVPASRAVGVGSDAERYIVSTDEGASFVEETFGYLQLAEEPRVRVEILNGNGLVGTTGPVARSLIDAGYRVVFTDNADRQDYTVSRLIAQGAEHQDAAVAIQRLLGTGDVFLEQRQPSGVVDLTIIVGSDLATQG